MKCGTQENERERKGLEMCRGDGHLPSLLGGVSHPLRRFRGIKRCDMCPLPPQACIVYLCLCMTLQTIKLAIVFLHYTFMLCVSALG